MSTDEREQGYQANDAPRGAALTRRRVLASVAGLVGGTALGSTVLAGPAAAWSESTHAPWRFCGDCFSMFYWGFAPSGFCPATRAPHRQIGWIFKIPFGGTWTPNDQPDWRFCRNCFSLWYSGYGILDRGRCLSNSIETYGHRSGSPFLFNYVLPHDIGEPPGTQARWEFCLNCYVLFYDGYSPQRGACFGNSGGGHVPHPDAYHFAVPVSSY
jgi:hypothetical protein